MMKIGPLAAEEHKFGLLVCDQHVERRTIILEKEKKKVLLIKQLNNVRERIRNTTIVITDSGKHSRMEAESEIVTDAREGIKYIIVIEHIKEHKLLRIIGKLNYGLVGCIS